jgi:hypothetical protein
MVDAVGLTLLNPHADDFVSTPLSFWLVGRRGLGKYRFLLEEPIRRGRPVAAFVDGTLSSLIDQSVFAKLPAWIRRLVLRIEIYCWLRINGLNGDVEVHWSPDTISDRSVLYVFSYKNCVGAFDQRMPALAAFKQVIVNLSHYFIRTGEKAANIAKLRNALLHVDSDHTRNEYFRAFFPNPPPSIVLPFAVSSRFVVKRPLSDRSQKCVATGSFHHLDEELPSAYYRDFMNFFKTDTYHPVRKILYQRRAELADLLECRTSPYREMEGKNTFEAKLQRLLRLDVIQADYFSFDIVDFYNQHRFAIVGEELSGAPAVGFFEAMACGCVMLGARGTYYDGLGLQPDVHYLEHDGTIESIRAAMTRIATNPDQMAAMVQAGKLYIDTHCTPQAVWDRLQANLDRSAGRSGP